MADFAKEQDDESKEEKGGRKEKTLTQIPITRVKRIIKSDPEVKLISTDACFIITKATVCLFSILIFFFHSV
jgi:hypothetical protein